MKIREALKQQREQRHWSQQELADQLQISRQSISKWERGAALPSFANVVAISDLFHLSIDQLIRGDAELMTKLTVKKDEDIGPVGRIIYGGLFWGAIGFLITWALGIGYEDAEELVQLPLMIIFVSLLLAIYANQKQHRAPLSRAVIWLSIGLIALMVLPMISMDVSAAMAAIPGSVRAGWNAGQHGGW